MFCLDRLTMWALIIITVNMFILNSKKIRLKQSSVPVMLTRQVFTKKKRYVHYTQCLYLLLKKNRKKSGSRKREKIT